MGDRVNSGYKENIVYRFTYDLFTSRINVALLAICAFLLYKIICRKRRKVVEQKEIELSPLKKQDFTPKQLREYNGKSNEGRILIAVNGKVFDVTKGKRFYGPGKSINTKFNILMTIIIPDECW